MAAVRAPVAYHLTPEAAWAAVPAGEPFRPASLETEGFVHLTHRMTDLVEVANAFYRDEPGTHVVLTIALRWLDVPWRYDGDERFPHVYGPLGRRAITEVRAIPRDTDGTYRPIERPDARRRPHLAALLARLVDARVDFVVVGSGAAALLGADLVPGDLDICPATGTANLRRLVGVLTAIGAWPRVDVPGWVTAEEAAAWRPAPEVSRLDFLFETELGDLDIVFEALGPGGRGSLDNRALRRGAIRLEVEGRPVVVASPAMLLDSKVGAGRPKDLRARAELERLVTRHGTDRGLGYGDAVSLRVGLPRRLILVLTAALALAVVAPVTVVGRDAPAPVPPGPVPATIVGSFSLDLSKPGDFVAQTNFVQCVGASMQMMLNMIRPADDRTASTQLRLQDLARSLSGQRPDGIVRQGASVRGWTAGLNQVGAGPYRTVGSSDLQSALRLAARAMRETNWPVGLLVWRGRHAWVMAGFTATADPRLTDDFLVTAVVILDPLYPYGSKTWGPSPRPRQSLSIAELARQFVARNGTAQLPGDGTDTSKVASGSAADAFRSWSAGLAGKYVIVAPYAVERVARGGHWIS